MAPSGLRRLDRPHGGPTSARGRLSCRSFAGSSTRWPNERPGRAQLSLVRRIGHPVAQRAPGAGSAVARSPDRPPGGPTSARDADSGGLERLGLHSIAGWFTRWPNERPGRAQLSLVRRIGHPVAQRALGTPTPAVWSAPDCTQSLVGPPGGHQVSRATERDGPGISGPRRSPQIRRPRAVTRSTTTPPSASTMTTSSNWPTDVHT